MGHRYNPITEEIESTGCQKGTETQQINPFPFTTFVAGKIVDMDEGFDNVIDACTLPIDSERQTIDLGELSELCD